MLQSRTRRSDCWPPERDCPDLSAVKESIAASLENLRSCMVWAQVPPTDESVLAFLGPVVHRFGGEANAEYAITRNEDGRYVGGCGLPRELIPSFALPQHHVRVVTSEHRQPRPSWIGLPPIRRERNCARPSGTGTVGAALEGASPTNGLSTFSPRRLQTRPLLTLFAATAR
jgi:hypothetical protein